MARRDDRYRLRDVLASITTLPRVGTCGRHRISREQSPSIEMVDGVAGFAGVQQCGAIHVCPVCSPQIRQERATEIDAAAVTWIKAHGQGSIMLLTTTLPHDHGERLADLLATVKKAFARMVSGRAWQSDKARYGIEFYIVAHDATVGRNGWHPHLHILVFCTAALDDVAVKRLSGRLYDRWADAIVKRGHRAPSRAHGLTLERARNRKDVTRYVCQVVAGDPDDDKKTVPMALEVARGDLKTARHHGQRTPWQVLGDIATRAVVRSPEEGKARRRDIALWREYEKAMKRVLAIRWAKGLRKAVGLGPAREDIEILEAPKPGRVSVFSFVWTDGWKAIATMPGARAGVLRAAEADGKAGVDWYVEETVRAWRAWKLRHVEPDPPALVPKPYKTRFTGPQRTMLAILHARWEAEATTAAAPMYTPAKRRDPVTGRVQE